MIDQRKAEQKKHPKAFSHRIKNQAPEIKHRVSPGGRSQIINHQEDREKTKKKRYSGQQEKLTHGLQYSIFPRLFLRLFDDLIRCLLWGAETVAGCYNTVAMEKQEGKLHIGLLLAGGKGTRFGGVLPKQYLPLGDKPVLAHSLLTMEQSFLDEILLICAAGDEEWCRKHILSPYSGGKSRLLPLGGKERYASVLNGLNSLAQMEVPPDYVYIQDGARPFLSLSLLENLRDAVLQYGGAVAATPSTDTIKVADGEGFVRENPARSTLFAVQTPQAFRFQGILEAYRRMSAEACPPAVTDDVEVYQRYTGAEVKLVVTDQVNIKITTPLDLTLAELLLDRYAEGNSSMK